MSSVARRAAAVLLLAVLAATAGPLAAARPAPRARRVMVAGPEPLAVAEGLRVLRQGGNAVDAAVTIGFVLAVTWPAAGNVGGGGFLLVRPASGDAAVIDYRETAPAAASRDMFLDPNGGVIPRESLDTYRAAGVPGTVAGLALALERFGTMPLSRALGPAVRLAREGFTVGRGLEAALAEQSERLARWPATRAVFFKDGAPLKEGDRLAQPDLARTLAEVAAHGSAAFYRSRIARELARDMREHGGLIGEEDLAAYRPVVRRPLRGAFRGHEILSAPPPSSGGVALMQMLAMLEPHPLRSLGHNSSAYVHVAAEAMKRAFADRARWLGDPEFARVPLSGLLSRDYAATLMRGFDPQRATPAAEAGPGDPWAFESPSTTHFSVVDASGGAAANTYTLNDSFGSGAVAGGLGFLLNNEMDDFSIKAGAPNLYGLVGGEANSLAPGKRMLSSMTPTMVVSEGRLRLVAGTPGGAAIITSVLQVLLNVLEFDMELQEAVDAPRFHHQWSPDRVRLENGGFPADVTEALRRRGHAIAEESRRGDVQAILLVPGSGWILGASDARGWGEARGE